MEPLKPEDKAGIMRQSPEVKLADIEEYETLLAARFTVDPEAPKEAEVAAAHAARESRVQELYRKLYPTGHVK